MLSHTTVLPTPITEPEGGQPVTPEGSASDREPSEMGVLLLKPGQGYSRKKTGRKRETRHQTELLEKGLGKECFEALAIE